MVFERRRKENYNWRLYTRASHVRSYSYEYPERQNTGAAFPFPLSLAICLLSGRSRMTMAALQSPPSINRGVYCPSSFRPNSPFTTNNRSSAAPLTRRRRLSISAKYVREDYLIKKVSSKEVQDLVKGERSIPLVVDFFATWCGPCILMAQVLETLAVEYESNALFVKVDTDDEYEFSRDMQVRGLPTLLFISPDPSKDAIRTEGLIPIEMIRNIIDNEM